MIDTLSPTQSPPSSNRIKIRPKSQQGYRNYANPDLHAGLDIVKVYSGLVSQHFKRSQFQNHSLKTACRPYNKQIQAASPNKMARSQSSLSKSNRVQSAVLLNRNKSDAASQSKKKSNIRGIDLQRYKYAKNPEDSQQNARSVLLPENKSSTYQQNDEESQHQNKDEIRKNFAYKAQIIPQYSQELQQVWNYKLQLQEQIKTLKTLLVSQRNKKARTSLSCNKIMNQCQNQQRNMRIKQQQNFNLNIMIEAIAKQNQFMKQQIEVTNCKLQATKKRVQQQKKECQQLKQFVESTRMQLMGQSKTVSKLKSKVSQSYNNMQNNYMNVNLLKGEKALLLTDIRQNYYKNA